MVPTHLCAMSIIFPLHPLWKFHLYCILFFKNFWGFETPHHQGVSNDRPHKLIVMTCLINWPHVTKEPTELKQLTGCFETPGLGKYSAAHTLPLTYMYQ